MSSIKTIAGAAATVWILDKLSKNSLAYIRPNNNSISLDPTEDYWIGESEDSIIEES